MREKSAVQQEIAQNNDDGDYYTQSQTINLETQNIATISDVEQDINNLNFISL